MGLAQVDRLELLTAAERRRWYDKLTDYAKRQIALGIAWWFVGRPEQMAPPGRWRWWLICAGRGWGKTRTGAEWCAAKARRYKGARIALVAPTFADARDTMVEGESGLLSVLHPSELRGGTVESAWNRSMGELFLANGSRFKVYTSEKPRQLRGPQHHFAWGDEPAYWNDVEQGTAKDSTWSNLNFGLRLPPRLGWDRDYVPQAVLTTTPRRVPLLKVPDEIAREKSYLAGLLQRPAREVIVTGGSTMDNLDNLDETYKAAVVDPLVGTTLGKQELGGVMLEDVEGALWTQALLDATRLVELDRRLDKRVVAMDPAGGEGFSHDEHGIVVAGARGHSRDPEFYVLADRSRNCSPTEACEVAILAYYEFGCHGLVVEKNQGQDWLLVTLKATWDNMRTAKRLPAGAREPRWELATAVKSKEERATPVAGLYEQKRVHHVGTYAVLEGQLTSWVPGDSDSPDRLDALVWAITWLYAEGPGLADVASPARRERRARGGRRGPNMPNTALPPVYDARRSGRPR